MMMCFLTAAAIQKVTFLWEVFYESQQIELCRRGLTKKAVKLEADSKTNQVDKDVVSINRILYIGEQK